MSCQTKTVLSGRNIHSLLTMKQLASLEKQGGSGKRCALLESGGEEYAFFNGRSKVGGEVGEGLLHYSRGGWTPLSIGLHVPFLQVNNLKRIKVPTSSEYRHHGFSLHRLQNGRTT